MDFDASLLVVMAIFWIVYAILRWTFFGPIVRLLDDRAATIQTAQSRFEEASARLDTGLAAQRERLAQARRNLAARREEVRRTAEAQRAALLDAARAEARAEIDAIKAALEVETAAERVALEAHADRLADDMVRRVLGSAA